MRYFGKKCWWCVSLLLVLGLQTSYPSISIPVPFKNIKLKPLTELTTKSPVRMSLIILPKEGYCDTLSFQVVGTNGLVSVGPDKQTLSANEDGNFVTEFEIMIPSNDTSELTIQILPASPWLKQMCWFVTTEDTVEYWKGNPRMHNGPFRSDPPTGRRGWIIPGEFPDLDSIYGIPPEMVHPRYRPDSNYYRSFIIDSTANEKSQLEEMHRIEKEPLTDAQLQYHTVGKDLYRRLEGETEFTLVKRMSAEESKAKRQAYLDSLADLPPNAEVRVCLNLRGHHLEFVEKTVGTLSTPESESYYHLIVTRKLLDQLREKGDLPPVKRTR